MLEEFLKYCAVSTRTVIIITAIGMILGSHKEIWSVLRHKEGWKAHLTQTVFVGLVVSGAIICSGNIFADGGWHIPEKARLLLVNIGLLLFLAFTFTGLYRRALKAGPENARKSMLGGLVNIAVGGAFVWLLMVNGVR